MDRKKKIMAALFIALAPALGLTGIPAADAPLPVLPVSYEGYVFLDVGPDFSGGILEMYARRGGEFVPGLSVKLEKADATYSRNGYHCRVKGMRPAAGSTVTVTIQDGGPLPALRPEVLSVTGTVPPLLAITAPRAEATVAAAGAPALEVAWKGDNPPYTLVIREVGSRAAVLSEAGLAATSYSVPMRFFTPGRKYMVQLLGSDHAMRFSSRVPAGSTFKLTQYRAIIIAVE